MFGRLSVIDMLAVNKCLAGFTQVYTSEDFADRLFAVMTEIISGE